MYEVFKTESKDVYFTCALCDAIFLSETGIEKHLAEHGEENYEDVGGAENYVMSPGMHVKQSGKEETRMRRLDQSLPWWLNYTSYVCDDCYAIFSCRSELRNHVQLEHNSREDDCARENQKLEPTKQDTDKMYEGLKASVSDVSVDSKARKIPLIKSKITKRLGPTNDVLRQVQTNQSANVLDKDKTCFKCGRICDSIMHRKNHILSHYYPTFYKVLPSCKPYSCPECGQVSRDRITLTRHYAFSHRKIYELTDVTERMLLCK